MNILIIKILILILVILLIGIYLHVIICESFITQTAIVISTQLINQVALKLNVSIRRIKSLNYVGDLATQKLGISFNILDPNVLETSNGEPNAQTAAATANNLFVQNNFIVKINNDNILLHKINQPNALSREKNHQGQEQGQGQYFNNFGLQDISKYAQQKHIKAPNDETITRFFKLQPNNRFILQPILQ